MSEHDPSRDQHRVRFEADDIPTRPIYAAGLALAVAAVVFVAIAGGVYERLARRQEAASPAPSPLAAEYARKQPPAPRLQSDARGDLLALRAAENEELGKLAWIDKNKGLVQIPIDRAMELLVAKGLPSRPGPGPSWTPAPSGIDPYYTPPADGHAAAEGGPASEEHGG